MVVKTTDNSINQFLPQVYETHSSAHILTGYEPGANTTYHIHIYIHIPQKLFTMSSPTSGPARLETEATIEAHAPTTTTTHTTITPTHTTNTPDRKITTLTAKLNGPDNYPEWVTTMKLFFQMTKIGPHRAWDIIEGTYRKPFTNAEEWLDGNNYIILTILKNSEPQVRSQIGTMEKAKDA